jgi:hypothetical protein
MNCTTKTLSRLVFLRDAMQKQATDAKTPEITEEFSRAARSYQAEIDLLLAQNI